MCLINKWILICQMVLISNSLLPKYTWIYPTQILIFKGLRKDQHRVIGKSKISGLSSNWHPLLLFPNSYCQGVFTCLFTLPAVKMLLPFADLHPWGSLHLNGSLPTCQFFKCKKWKIVKISPKFSQHNWKLTFFSLKCQCFGILRQWLGYLANESFLCQLTWKSWVHQVDTLSKGK